MSAYAQGELDRREGKSFMDNPHVEPTSRRADADAWAAGWLNENRKNPEIEVGTSLDQRLKFIETMVASLTVTVASYHTLANARDAIPPLLHLYPWLRGTEAFQDQMRKVGYKDE